MKEINKLIYDCGLWTGLALVLICSLIMGTPEITRASCNCDSLEGGQGEAPELGYELCNAFCAVLDCDTLEPKANPEACAAVRMNYYETTGEFFFPGEAVCPCFSIEYLDSLPDLGSPFSIYCHNRHPGSVIGISAPGATVCTWFSADFEEHSGTYHISMRWVHGIPGSDICAELPWHDTMLPCGVETDAANFLACDAVIRASKWWAQCAH